MKPEPPAIIIPETRISRFSETKIGLNITLEIKEEDVNNRKLLRELYKDSTLIVAVLKKIDNEGVKDNKEVKEETKIPKGLSTEYKLRKLIIEYGGGEYGGGNEFYDKVKKDEGINHLSELDNLAKEKLYNKYLTLWERDSHK